MATFRSTNGSGSVSSNSAVASLAVPIGSAVAAGDLLVIVAAFNATATGTTFTTPSGWTVLSSTTDSGASAIVSVGTFYKIAVGGDASSTVTVTHSVSARGAAVSAAFSGTNGSFDGALPAATKDNGAAGGTTTITNPSLTGLSFTNDCAILVAGTKQDTASATAVTYTPPAGYTNAITASGTSAAGNNGSAAIAYKVKSDTSDETSPAFTTNLAIHYVAVAIPLEDTSPAGAAVPPRQILVPSLSVIQGARQ